ncbi:hypothetical protein GCM10011380_00950 [Sphingomonas metalli]|uniref:Uncharacterized protein n=1 Tax=Sphingomonas metalli TaxID=1779358 RepID=A0A916SSU0_9SPHN|nr:hypothetical protein [Sphingomonas metalli]GGB15317.1 hypothetical protein GCM10011380_00950 [Sphingomonas metalli]
MVIEAILAGLLVIAALLATLAAAARFERRRRARWWRWYFHEGGLVRELMRRWNGPKRLTWRPEDRDRS